MTTIALGGTDARYSAGMREWCDGHAPIPIFALGNLDLLELPNTALFCSARCPRDAILDKVDQVLAQYFGFTAAELDFMLNYDI